MCHFYIQLLVITLACQYMHYIHLHSITFVTCFCMTLHALYQTIFHYIPFTECIKRQLSRLAFAGHQHLKFEPLNVTEVPKESRCQCIRPGELWNLV